MGMGLECLRSDFTSPARPGMEWHKSIAARRNREKWCDAVIMAAVSMLMSRRFRRVLLAPVVLGDFAVFDLAGCHQLHSALGAGAWLFRKHGGVLGHRTSIKRRRDGYRVGPGLGCWRGLHHRDQRHAAFWALACL